MRLENEINLDYRLYIPVIFDWEAETVLVGLLLPSLGTRGDTIPENIVVIDMVVEV